MGTMTRLFVLSFVTCGLPTIFPIVNGLPPGQLSTEFTVIKEGGVEANVSLDLTSLGLTKLREGFADSPYLTWLSLEENELRDISHKAFEKVPNLSYLNLEGNRLTNLNLEKFSGLKKLETLVLDGNNMISTVATNFDDDDSDRNSPYQHRRYNYYTTSTVAPLEPMPLEVDLSTELPALTHLYLRNNKIEKILFSHDNSLPMLTHLFISDNVLVADDNILSELKNNAPSLTHIYLDRNNILSLNVTKMENIVSISVEGNNLNSICSQYCDGSALCLKGANRLQFLSASNNQLTKIENDAFNFTSNLLHLNLSHNRITTIREGTFDKLSLLEYLSLENNQLSSIDDGSLSIGLSRLSHLSLGHNKIPKIFHGSFKRLPSLRKLSLNHNLISNIETGAFTDLPMLEELSLSNNLLSTIPSNCWPRNGALRQLDISYNRFTNTEDLSMDETTQLSDLYLKGNPLTKLNMDSLLNVSKNLSIIIGYECERPAPTCDCEIYKKKVRMYENRFGSYY